MYVALTQDFNKSLTPDDAIVEAPSLVTPFLLKLKPRDVQPELESSEDSSDDEVKIIEPDGVSRHKANRKQIDEYIKTAAVSSLVRCNQNVPKPPLTINDFYRSSAGELLMGIGLSRVREFTLDENVRRLNHRIRKGEDGLIHDLDVTMKELAEARSTNAVYKPKKPFFRCPHCPFYSEFATVLDGHLDKLHISSRRDYTCNWCDFRIKDSNQMVFHNFMVHRKRGYIEKPLSSHCCSFCPYECRSKRKLEVHMFKCEKNYNPDTFLGPHEFEEHGYPAVTSKLITQEDIKVYDETLKALRLAAYNPHQLKITGSLPQAINGQPILVVPRPQQSTLAGKSTMQTTPARVFDLGGTGSLRSSITMMPRHHVHGPHNTEQSQKLARAQLMHLMSTQATRGSISNNHCTLVQGPKSQSSFVNGMGVIKSASNLIMAPSGADGDNLTLAQSNSNKFQRGRQVVDLTGTTSQPPTSLSPKTKTVSTFVICEICDAYIKDLSQLRSHMQWIHQVRMHQKVLESRPPLSCQKCHWRFFTDQGLERHLLGAHGLVTSNMQELVDKGTDGGRCTVCGRAYANKLVAHMKEVHKSNLKPAHLSYKCTVCSATFNLYRLFENHVYSVHRQ